MKTDGFLNKKIILTIAILLGSAILLCLLLLLCLFLYNSDLQNRIEDTKNVKASSDNQLTRCFSEKITERAQLDSCTYTSASSESDASALEHDYGACQTDLSEATSDYDACSDSLSEQNNSLASCSSELSDYKDSECGSYSQHMHATDTRIQTAATSAKNEIEAYISNAGNYNSMRSRIAAACQDELGGVSYTKLIGAMGSYYWLVDHITYINTPFSSNMRDDTTVLQLEAGQCNEQALLLASMLRSQGIKADIIHLDVPEPYCSGSCGHAITIAYIDGLSNCPTGGWSFGTDTILLDPTWKGEFGKISYMSTDMQLDTIKLVEVSASAR